MSLVIQAVILLLAVAAAFRDGERRTNARWHRWATRVEHGHDNDARKWHHRPGWQRAVARFTAVILAAEIAIGLAWYRGTVILVLALTALLAVSWAAAWAYRRARQHAAVIGRVTLKEAIHRDTASQWINHRAGSVVRLRETLAGPEAFGVTPYRVKVAPDLSLIDIRAPFTFAGHKHQLEAVTSVVRTLIPREGLELDTSKLHGRAPRLRFTLTEPPPGILYWEGIAARIGGVGDDDLVTGIGHRGKLITASLKSDSPHLGIGMGTGAGKSNLAAFWLVQRLRRGDFALIVDGKRFSHPWAFKDMAAGYDLLPNVGYVRSISDIHDALVWLGLELAARNQYVEQKINAKGDVLGAKPRRLFAVLEELNYVVPQLKSYWARQRDLLLAIAKEEGTEKPPKQSPALMALSAAAAAGRAVGIHLIFIGQRLDAEVLGGTGGQGGAVRGNIGVRALARYDEAAWKMQAGGAPMPPSPSVDGRIQLWIGGQVSECQVPLMDHKRAISELRELATGGTVTKCPPGMPGRGQVSVRDNVTVLHATDQQESVGQAPDPDKVTLRQAHDQFVFGQQKYDTVSRYSRRSGFPANVGWDGNTKVYLLADLYAWQAKKEKVPA